MELLIIYLFLQGITKGNNHMQCWAYQDQDCTVALYYESKSVVLQVASQTISGWTDDMWLDPKTIMSQGGSRPKRTIGHTTELYSHDYIISS